jgi:hypothetical protein
VNSRRGWPGRLGSPTEAAGWAVLALLLVATFVAALRFDRTGRPSLVGDEATFAMQAASLAFDFDLAYTRADYDRFVAHWGGPPDGLILQSRDRGRHITYGKPFLYALVAAPFVRLAPVGGAVAANALLLAAAALAAARALRRRLGAAAPLWVAVLVFASVSFAYVFWVHADLFLLATTAAGFALVYGGEPAAAGPRQIYGEEPAERGFVARWAGAGALLAVAGTFRPFYLALLLPAALAVPGGRRRRGLLALAAGALGLLLLSGFVQWHAGGHWSGYGGERQGFYPRTGYPLVDFPASGWEHSLERWGNTSWLQAGAFEPRWSWRLLGWDALYFLVGRDVGVLPYFLPLLLGFVACRGERGRWAIPLAVAVAAACFFVVRPFNFYGGGGAIANRYFLPLYAALWFLAARPARAAWALAAAALAAPFLLPLWRHPTAFPIGDDGRYRHVSAAASRLLPYETTQSHIPGGQDVAVDGLWLKLLNHDLWRPGEGASLRLLGGATGELLVGSPRPLSGLALDFDRHAPSRLEVGRAELRPTALHPDGSIGFEVPLGRPRAVHPMWWTSDDYYLYELELRLPAPAVPIALRIRPLAEDGTSGRRILIRKRGP